MCIGNRCNMHDLSICGSDSIPDCQLWRHVHVLTFKSVGEILWCDHSNETSVAS